MSLLTTLSFSSLYSFRFSGLRRVVGVSGRSLSISLSIGISTGNVSRNVLSCNSLSLVFVLLSLAQEEEMSLLSVLGKSSAFVLLSLA